MVCNVCDKDSADGFKFCPHCGNTFTPALSVNEPPIPPPEVQSVTDTLTDESEPIRDGVAGTAIRVGTLVFGGFSAISLLVSIVKGLVPIYLLEAAGWAGVAWYWQAKKTHSDFAKAVVVVIAILVGIGEVVHIASQADTSSQPKPPTAVADSITNGNLFDQGMSSGKLQDKPEPQALPPCPSGIRAGAKIAEIEPEEVEGSDGDIWYVATDKDSAEKGGWYFHFTVINHAKDFCLTAIEYEVDLELDDGTFLKGHGKKHIDTLSPEWKYTPHSETPDDLVKFAVKSDRGALSTWKITKAYGFSQEPPAPN